jgi:hypothetical protein
MDFENWNMSKAETSQKQHIPQPNRPVQQMREKPSKLHEETTLPIHIQNPVNPRMAKFRLLSCRYVLQCSLKTIVLTHIRLVSLEYSRVFNFHLKRKNACFTMN